MTFGVSFGLGYQVSYDVCGERSFVRAAQVAERLVSYFEFGENRGGFSIARLVEREFVSSGMNQNRLFLRNLTQIIQLFVGARHDALQFFGLSANVGPHPFEKLRQIMSGAHG